jgi:hypothetical protein
MPPDVAGSWGPDVADLAPGVLGHPLDRWQRVALNRMLAYGPDGRLVHRVYLLSTARQNGKTALVRALIAWALVARHSPPWTTVIGLAHDKTQARLPYSAIANDLQPIARRVGPLGRGGLAITRYLGIRSNLYGRFREYKIASREARDSVRGESSDLVYFDEVRTQRDHETWAAIEPTTTARPDPLILLTSTAGTERSVLLRDLWERGIRVIDGAEPSGGFGMTWYAAGDGQATDDPAAWRAANPSLAEGRLSEAAIAQGIANAPTPAMARSERLNLWTEGMDEWLPAGVWRDTIAAEPEPIGPVVLGVDVVPSWRRATVQVAYLTADGAWVGPVGDLDATRSGASSVSPTELVAALDAIADEWHPAAVAFSSSSAAGRHVAAWAEARDVRELGMGAREVRAASQLFRSELVGRRLRHLDDPLTSVQVPRARPSGPLEGGEWYLSVRESTGEIDAVRAAAWAAWAAIAPPEAERELQIFLPRPR